MSKLFRVAVARYTSGEESYDYRSDPLLFQDTVRGESVEQIERAIDVHIKTHQLDVYVSEISPIDIAALSKEMEDIKDRYL